MRKFLLFAIATSLGSIAFAAGNWYCERFSPPQWRFNLKGCKSCPVTNSQGELITCESLPSNHVPIAAQDCCWNRPPLQTSGGTGGGRYSCTTDHFAGLYSSPECDAFFAQYGGRGGKGNNKGGKNSSIKSNTKNVAKVTKSTKITPVQKAEKKK